MQKKTFYLSHRTMNNRTTFQTLKIIDGTKCSLLICPKNADDFNEQIMLDIHGIPTN